jgi:hypothetical protein
MLIGYFGDVFRSPLCGVEVIRQLTTRKVLRRYRAGSVANATSVGSWPKELSFMRSQIDCG